MIAEFVEIHIKNSKEIDQVIICDGIHFMNSEVGIALQDELNKVYQHKIPISLFKYISPKYSDSHFNGVPLRENNNFDFSKFVTEQWDKLLPLFKDAKQGERVLNQLLKSFSISDQTSYSVLVKFIKNVEDKLLIQGGADLCRSYINSYLVENISLDLLKNENESRMKPKL